MYKTELLSFFFKPDSYVALLMSVHGTILPDAQAQAIVLYFSFVTPHILSGNPTSSSFRLYIEFASSASPPWSHLSPNSIISHLVYCSSLLTGLLPPWSIYSLFSSQQINKCNLVPTLGPINLPPTLPLIYSTHVTLSSLFFL